MLSIITPLHQEPYLKQTIDSLLDNAEGDIEVIPVFDGAVLTEPLRDDPRLKPIFIEHRGMRGAINAGVSIAKGEFIMRSDEHCMFGPGFDKILTESCQPNWIMTATRYFLDPILWERMDMEPVNFEKLEKLVIQENKKFAGQRWTSSDIERKDVMIDETMAMQGSMWMMKKTWWDKVIGELQTEGYGPLIQDSHEMVFKTWKAGGKLMLNKNTWFAHKHRDFPRSHNNGTVENPAHCDDGYAYALSVWKDYYEKEIVPKWRI